MRTIKKANKGTLLPLKLGPMLRLLGLCSVLISVAVPTARAANFDPVDLNEASLQSRKFEGVRLNVLVNACFMVIQDIGFHVVETESEPVVIVANAQGRGAFTLTVNLQSVDEDTDSYRVRLMLNSPVPHLGWLGQSGDLSDEANFYQDFFSHLDKTYFTERLIQ